MSFKVLITIDEKALAEGEGLTNVHTNVRSFWEAEDGSIQETRDPGRVLSALEHARLAVHGGIHFEAPRLVRVARPLDGKLSAH